jgi:sec-independent protein translocase protein TatB
MIDFGFDKLALIGAVALVVIGPQKLPRVARTIGALLGKAQRYVSDVKAEVNRSIELEELQKMKGQIEGAARDVEQTVTQEMRDASAGLNPEWDANAEPSPFGGDYGSGYHGAISSVPTYTRPRKNWRLRRSAMPRWYKQRHGVRGKVQSGAARVARHRPRSSV